MSDPKTPRADQILRLNAALDDELDAANRLDLDREMENDEALRRTFATLARTRGAVARHAPREAAPERLVARIAALGAAAPAPRAAQRLRSQSIFALAASLAVGALLGAFAATTLVDFTSPDRVAQSLAADFARSEVSGQPIDVASSDRHTVKPWLAGRIAFGVVVVDLAAEGYPLAGGRISVVDRAPAPTLVYRRREHMIAVTELPLGAKGTSADLRETTLDGYRILRWSDGKLAYAAVSDIDPPELQAFVTAFRSAGAKVGEGG